MDCCADDSVAWGGGWEEGSVSNSILKAKQGITVFQPSRHLLCRISPINLARGSRGGGGSRRRQRVDLWFAIQIGAIIGESRESLPGSEISRHFCADYFRLPTPLSESSVALVLLRFAALSCRCDI